MVAPSDLIPDAEPIARAWAASVPEIAALVDNGDGTVRIATRLPETPVFPFLTVVRVGGTLGIDTEAPIDEALMQFDAYAGKGQKGPDYASASVLIRNVAHALFEADNVQAVDPITGNALIYGFELFSGPRRLEEPQVLWARYTIDVTMVFRRS